MTGAGESPLVAGHFADLFYAAVVPSAVLDAEGCYLAVNPAMCALLQRSAADLLDSGFADVTHDDDVAAGHALLGRIRAGPETTARLEKRYLRPDGTEIAAAVHFAGLSAEAGEWIALAQVIDLTDQRRAELLLAHQATHDPATGLVTRGVYLEQLARALARLPRVEGRYVVVLFCDLDRLKYVNDTHGHLAGDALIAEFARRVQAAVRPSDVVARLGGDEFGVLLEDVAHPVESAEIAQRVLDALAEPFLHDRRRLEIRASIGIAVSTEQRTTPETILAHADSAMYRAKNRGRGRYELFDDDAYTAARARQTVEQQLRDAIKADQLLLHYQPLLVLGTHRIVGVEALLRWRKPDGSVVAASEFIAVAEEADLLRPLTGWLFTTACAQLAAWDSELGSLAPQQMYVNIGGSQLADDDLATTIAGALHTTAISPDRLCIEVTETQILTHPAATAATVAELLQMGCQLVVDDFGTGYSTLSRLRACPGSRGTWVTILREF